MTQCLPQRKHQHPINISFQAHVKLSCLMVARRSGLYCKKRGKNHSLRNLTKIWLMKALVWPVSTYGCESWTLRKHKETRLDAFEIWDERTEKDSAGVRGQQRKQMSGFLTKLQLRELSDTVKARKLAYCNHTMRKQRSCLEKEIMQVRGVVLKRSGGRLKQDLDEDLKTL